MAKQTEYNVGIYLHLSQEDLREGDSLSIKNQKLILTKFVEDKGWTLVSEYVDDVYTGTDFERPGVQKLLADTQSGKINIIVVKDLSRFGRNYIEVGRYIDYIFPMNNIRFIAINDNVDTAERNSAALEMMPIVTLFNEWHSSSTSKKIRAVYEANAKSGNYMGSLAPYGYERSDTPNHTLVIDPETAPVVKRLFNMRLSGMSYGKIAAAMNKESILTPMEYRYDKWGKTNPRFTSGVWSDSLVKTLLHNPVYLGKLVQLRTTTVSHKNHKVINKDPSEWAVVENTHEPIITQEIWDRIQEIDKSRSRGKRTKSGITYPLSGFCCCFDCGHKMRLINDPPSYICGTYAKSGRTVCSTHCIRVSVIEEIVLADIRSMLKLTVNEEKARKVFLERKTGSYAKQLAKDKNKLKAHERRLAELEKLIRSVYEDKVMGRVAESMALSLLGDYQQEKEKLTAEIAILKESCEAKQQAENDVNEFIRRLKKYAGAEKLTRAMTLELLEYVVIDKNPRKRHAEREIHIYYKFLDAPNPNEEYPS
ncbi:MAG: recombinase family protein [Ruminococcus sp.]|nr:recombinase family protein [Ruminococcus sp.]